MNKKVLFLGLALVLLAVPVFAYDFFSEINRGFDIIKADFYNKEVSDNSDGELITGKIVSTNEQTCPKEKTLFKLSTSTNSHAAVSYDKKYDINNDKFLDQIDVDTLSDVVLGKITCPISLCDLNDDKSVDVGDIQVEINFVTPLKDYTFRVCSSLNLGDRTCNGNNVIIKLSDNFNAHVEKPSLNNYNVNVCSSGISCSYKSGSCSAGEECVASISGDTNAHVSDCTGGYDTKLCCKASACSGPDFSSNECKNEDVCKNAGGTWWPPNDPAGGCCGGNKRWSVTDQRCVDATSFSTCNPAYPPIADGIFSPSSPPYSDACCSASIAYGFLLPVETY